MEVNHQFTGLYVKTFWLYMLFLLTASLMSNQPVFTSNTVNQTGFDDFWNSGKMSQDAFGEFDFVSTEGG